jgi:hypothetical protein
LTSNKADEVLHLRKDRVTWREVDGEVIVRDLERATYFAVDPSAARLWLALSRGVTRSALIDDLVTTYEIDEPKAAEDVDTFISSCRANDLLDE